MVQHDNELLPFSTAFAEWWPLLAACSEYAHLSGWRFVKGDFMRLDGREAPGVPEAREKAMPMALEYADRVCACLAALAEGAEPPRLLTEFQACQRLIAREAVYNSMLATIAAVGLSDGSQPAADDDDADPERFAFHDMTQPIEVIAQRLLAYNAHVDASPADKREKGERLLHASFIVEFGLEHGMPEFRDRTSEAMLTDFLSRLGEWEGGRDNEAVRALVLQSIPPGPAGKGLRAAASEWFNAHPKETIIGGAIVGGVLGILVAGAAVALASGAGRRASR